MSILKTKVNKNVADVLDENDRPLLCVNLESCLMLTDYVVEPSLTPEQKQYVGNILDAHIAEEAHKQGRKSVLLVVPRELRDLFPGECREVCIVETELPQHAKPKFDLRLAKPATPYVC